ncbi:hypothetical protein BGX31_011037 [Mortierella sp. GBA43]|nr:hypothetical protein BGX31_011037 [Mortierella sp. GBA43]
MGNVSSADHDKVSELMTRRARKKIVDRRRHPQQQQQQQQQCRSSGANSNGVYPNGNGPHAKTSKAQPLPHPLDQAEFYSVAASSSSTNLSSRNVEPYSPSSPSFSVPSSATTPTSSRSDLSYLTSKFDDRLDTGSATAAAPTPTSPHQQQIPQRSPQSTHQHQQQQFQGQYHSSPIVISQQRLGHNSTNSVDDSHFSKGPTPPGYGYVPVRRGSEHVLHLQQQPDPHVMGTSPEAKDWLKQKPTRSSTQTHMIHQYNFHTQTYYQQPGAKVNSTSRNMGDYASVPTVPSLNTRSFGVPAGRSTAPLAPVTNCATNGDNNTLSVNRAYTSAPIPNSRARGMSQPETSAQKMVMSRSKLTSPLATSVLPSTGAPTYSSPLGSPIEGPHGSEADAGTRRYRASSTLSSLRSLLGNHPQGLTLIESLEEDEDDGFDSLSETETGDSDSDLAERTRSLTTMDEPGGETIDARADRPPRREKRSNRKRPPPKFEWMQARILSSASSLPTISRDIHDSQKGQHALWKYIGGGNSHAPLRFDIDRILDSGCGLGEWTMEIAKEFPNATVYGIDINPELFPGPHQPVPSNCLFTQSNLLQRLSFPNQYFDFVYQRFLYLGLTVDDWPVALTELKRVMKPGGWLELFEPCMRVHRAGPRTREVMRWISRLLQEERGLDFDFAGEKMRRLCESEEVGFHNVKLERLSIPVGSWGGRVGQAMAENMVLIFQNLQSALLPNDDAVTPNSPAQKAFEMMVQSWIRECEENKSYIDYYILTAQRPPEN